MVAYRRLDPEEQVNELRRRIEIGTYMTSLRNERGISLANLGKVLDVSANFISEVERGIKSPGDKYIRKFSNHFDVDESYLFRKYGKIPLLARDELADNVMLQKMLEEIRKNPHITDERKKLFYADVYELYKTVLNEQ
jgi:transcriptional regulator with XRE-family HTH domain